jgi:hypothetical protein
MIKRALLISMMFMFFVNITDAQMFIRISDLFPTKITSPGSGELNIIQDQSVDTLLSRYILGNKLLNGGMEGFRIQIYRSSTRSAREESNKVRADFMVEFPEIQSYAEYEKPGYFLYGSVTSGPNLMEQKHFHWSEKNIRMPILYPVLSVSRI